MSGGELPEPLYDLWLRTRRVLSPFGIAVGPEVLALWRDQSRHRQGPIRAAERGDTQAVDELVAMLQLLTETQDTAVGSEYMPQ